MHEDLVSGSLEGSDFTWAVCVKTCPNQVACACVSAHPPLLVLAFTFVSRPPPPPMPQMMPALEGPQSLTTFMFRGFFVTDAVDVCWRRCGCSQHVYAGEGGLGEVREGWTERASERAGEGGFVCRCVWVEKEVGLCVCVCVCINSVCVALS